MFEEQYRADNDAITPSPALVDKTAAAMRQEAGRLPAWRSCLPPSPSPG